MTADDPGRPGQQPFMARETLTLEQLHIDVARNSTDDFNPFHDPLRYGRIVGNPFRAPIALGFQLEFLCGDRIMRCRAAEERASQATLPFRNFEFNFTGAVHAGEPFEIDVRRTIDKVAQGAGLSNRVIVRKAADGSPLLIGTQSESAAPRVGEPVDAGALPALRGAADRTILPGTALFLKRKFLTTSNAKNFCLAALCHQQDYIDELANRVHFAPLFTASLISCALLERGLAQGHDFVAEPMVYTSHRISVDLRVQAGLRSNMAIHLLVAPPQAIGPGTGLGKACVPQQNFHCAAVLDSGAVLLSAEVQLASLQSLATLNTPQAAP